MSQNIISSTGVTMGVSDTATEISTRPHSDGSVSLVVSLCINVPRCGSVDGECHSLQQRVEIIVEPSQLARAADELAVASDIMRRRATAHVDGCRCAACLSSSLGSASGSHHTPGAELPIQPAQERCVDMWRDGRKCPHE